MNISYFCPPIYYEMRLSKKQIARYSFLLFLIVLIGLVQGIPSWGTVYAYTIYPHIAYTLSSFSRVIPFSAGDLFILISILWLTIFPIYSKYKKFKWKKILFRMTEYLLWIYVWFYTAWGLNYSQPDFYQRTQIPYAAYTPENFRFFLDDYIENLNASYASTEELDKTTIHREVVEQYIRMEPALSINKPRKFPRVKNMMFPSVFTSMGISGYMGPFFCEFNVNSQNPDSQYASTYAHELAHYLGISSEAEANFYAYVACTRSGDDITRFTGYFSILSHVLNNAYYLLTEDEYRLVIKQIRPEIIDLSKVNRTFWVSNYNRTFGAIQDWIYNLYLKSNRIQSGTKNYSEVIGLLISWQTHNRTLKPE